MSFFWYGSQQMLLYSYARPTRRPNCNHSRLVAHRAALHSFFMVADPGVSYPLVESNLKLARQLSLCPHDTAAHLPNGRNKGRRKQLSPSLGLKHAQAIFWASGRRRRKPQEAAHPS